MAPFVIKVVAFILLFSQATLGLRCYTCNSAKDEGCALSPPPEKYLIECSHDTLEVLNDFHRQSRFEEAALAASHSAHNHSISSHHEDPLTSASSPVETLPEHPRPATDDTDYTIPPQPTEDASENPMSNRNSRSLDGNETVELPPTPVVSPVQLPKEATLCRKSTYHIPAQSNGENSTFKASIRVLRSCGWIREDKKEDDTNQQDNSCKWVGTDGVQMDLCVCSHDGCNGAGFLESLKIQTLLVVTVITTGYLYIL